MDMGEHVLQESSDGPDFFHRYRIPFIFLVASVVLIVVSISLFLKTQTISEPITFSSDTQKIASSSAELVIDISGGVRKPGIYHLAINSRVTDAIQRAGGFSGIADQKQIEKVINQAAFLTDGMKIYIPVIQQDVPQDISSDMSDGYVSINLASQDKLESLSGIGEVTAKKIIDGRPYTAIEELVTKKIISASLLDKLKGQFSL